MVIEFLPAVFKITFLKVIIFEGIFDGILDGIVDGTFDGSNVGIVDGTFDGIFDGMITQTMGVPYNTPNYWFWKRTFLFLFVSSGFFLLYTVARNIGNCTIFDNSTRNIYKNTGDVLMDEATKVEGNQIWLKIFLSERPIHASVSRSELPS